MPLAELWIDPNLFNAMEKDDLVHRMIHLEQENAYLRKRVQELSTMVSDYMWEENQ